MEYLLHNKTSNKFLYISNGSFLWVSGQQLGTHLTEHHIDMLYDIYDSPDDEHHGHMSRVFEFVVNGSGWSDVEFVPRDGNKFDFANAFDID